ncbi:MAG: SDR family NAD(P)-dependent oxidoreductase, partial [Pseudomonadota bacterium]
MTSPITAPNLTGKRALVCGASRGIGAAVARALAAAGARVTALARNADALAELVHALPAPDSGRHEYLAVDVTDADGLQSALTGRLDNRNAIDVL